VSVLWLIAGWAGIAQAGPFTQKSSQGEAPETQVDRRLVLPRGWLELGVRADSKSSNAYRDGQGRRKQRESNWRYSRGWLDVRQGFSKRITLYGSMPWVMAELSPQAGTVTRTVAMGDAHIGLVAEPWNWEEVGLGFSMDLKAPSGVEWPGDVVSGPDQVSSFLTGTGTSNFAVQALGRAVIADRIGVRAGVGYVHKFAGVVGYVVQDDGFGNGWIDPGDEIRLDADATGQIIDSLALSLGARWSRRSAYKMGVSGPGTTRRVMSELPGGAGSFLDARVGLSWEPSDHWELHAHGARDVAGSDTRVFSHLGLEEFSPQPGIEAGMGVRVRW